MQVSTRYSAGFGRLAAIGLIAAALLIARPAEAQRNNDYVFLGGCNGPAIVGSCVVSSTDAVRGLTLFPVRSLGQFPITSDEDAVYFDSPYNDADITVTVRVRSGPDLDIVSLGSPPGPGQYAFNWTTSNAPRRTHQLATRGGRGRYWVRIGSNYRSGPGRIVYDVEVRVSRRFAPIAFPFFRANNCQPPVDLGTLRPGGGTANLRVRNYIYANPGDIDCYEFNTFRTPSGGFNPFTLGLGTGTRIRVGNLPNSGTKFLYLLDITNGRWRLLRSTTGTSFDEYANLVNGRYRLYVIVGRDALSPSQFNLTLTTY